VWRLSTFTLVILSTRDEAICHSSQTHFSHGWAILPIISRALRVTCDPNDTAGDVKHRRINNKGGGGAACTGGGGGGGQGHGLREGSSDRACVFVGGRGGVIDDVDKSINSNQTTVMMRKDFYPSINSTFFYEVCFQNKFLVDCDEPSMQSTGFVVSEYPNFTVYLEDRANKIVLYRLDSLSGDKIILNDFVGDINYEKGEIMLYNLTIIKGSYFDNRIEIRVKPALNDVNALRNVYLDVDIPNSKFNAYQE
jgi:hypothetical protein